jgi:hypothetical protein
VFETAAFAAEPRPLTECPRTCTEVYHHAHCGFDGCTILAEGPDGDFPDAVECTGPDCNGQPDGSPALIDRFHERTLCRTCEDVAAADHHERNRAVISLTHATQDLADSKKAFEQNRNPEVARQLFEDLAKARSVIDGYLGSVGDTLLGLVAA